MVNNPVQIKLMLQKGADQMAAYCAERWERCLIVTVNYIHSCYSKLKYLRSEKQDKLLHYQYAIYLAY